MLRSKNIIYIFYLKIIQKKIKAILPEEIQKYRRNIKTYKEKDNNQKKKKFNYILKIISEQKWEI